MITLDQLGNKICVIGCSNSGKSTLSHYLSKKINIPAYHLDQLAHLPNSKWQRLPNEVLIAEHDRIIQQNSWIIEGNYSVCMSQRFDVATSVIWLDPTVYSALFRYLLRSIKNDPNRPGRLEGAQQEFSLALIKFILFNYPKNRLNYMDLLKQRPHLLLLHIKSMDLLKKYYKFWDL